MTHHQDDQQLLGSPRIQQDELSGGLIIAPGSETTAAVSAPLSDIAGGKSGTAAEIENPYEQRATAVATATSGNVPQQQPVQASGSHSQPGLVAGLASEGARGQQHVAGSALEGVTGRQEGVTQGTDAKGDEYSDQRQAQQATTGCKQS